VRLLLDTQLMLWATIEPKRLSPGAREIIEDRSNELTFSAVSIWEIAIKYALGRADFTADPAAVRAALLEDAYRELAFTSDHAIEIKALPPLHRDPFDRALLAQAARERIALLTSDTQLGRYPGAMRV
jgi:PIN domain nuclease of toxin-antitoxin system